MGTFRRVVLILADGARADLMRELLGRGDLPEIGRHLDGSLRDCVTAFPSTTGPAYLPFLTGCYPGTCNIPGIRWFDKDRYARNPLWGPRFRSYVGAETLLMNRDLSRQVRTLFELIPRSGSLFNSVHRGVGFLGDRSRFSHIWYGYYGHLTDHWGIMDEAAEAKTLGALRDDPEFFFVVFPGVDKFSHYSDPFHPRTLEAYRQLDRSVGKFVSFLKKEGRWEGTAIFIVSDHGLSETKSHFPLNQFLEKAGIRTLYYPKVVFKWGFEAASMVSGNGMSHLYYKNGRGWRGRTSWEELLVRRDRIVERLLERPEVDLLVAQRGDGSVVAKGRRGEAVISGWGRGLRYTVIGSDPFGYSSLPATMTDREALQKTFGTGYPDAPAQLLQIFCSPRAGDLILCASSGYDLRLRHEIPEHKSSHGSLCREHMMTPLVSNVRLPETPIRTVDIFPTILKLLGRPFPAGCDGGSLI